MMKILEHKLPNGDLLVGIMPVDGLYEIVPTINGKGSLRMTERTVSDFYGRDFDGHVMIGKFSEIKEDQAKEWGFDDFIEVLGELLSPTDCFYLFVLNKCPHLSEQELKKILLITTSQQ